MDVKFDYWGASSKDCEDLVYIIWNVVTSNMYYYSNSKFIHSFIQCCQ